MTFFTFLIFADLKILLVNHQGTYPLNLSMTDHEMIGIFGESNKVTEHHRPTMVYDHEKENRWGCEYWGNFLKKFNLGKTLSLN